MSREMERVIFFAAPVGMHGTRTYEEAVNIVRGRHGGEARLEIDAGRWPSAKDWRATYKKVLANLGVTDLYVLTAKDLTVGRGIYDMWRYLTEELGASARAALFPNGEELEGFALRVIDPENWTRYAVPVPGEDPHDGPPEGATKPGEGRETPPEDRGAGAEGEGTGGPRCAVCGLPMDTARELYSEGRGKTILGPEYTGVAW